MFARSSLLAIITALGVVGANGLSLSRASCQTTYSVVSGDTCNSIAAKVNVTTSALEAANPSIDPSCDNLFIGEQLCIPGTITPPPPPPCASKYTVKSGDVCISIADQFNITVTQLETSNPAIDPACDNLQIGEVLCIP
ncbi:carbohydrate-binding module family 50 protein [Collybiopsis luxurians FD-317 M1]|nr:carbohydrate-binding module family 50 protein [Collybiopsis luxurians FD-317 M1]